MAMRNQAYSGPLKRVVWMSNSKRDLKSFPPDVVDETGYQLFRVQRGLDPIDWKPMATIGIGAREIRVKDATGIFRTVYLATRSDAIYVLHCFQKKTQQTNQRDIDLARQRLRSIPR